MGADRFAGLHLLPPKCTEVWTSSHLASPKRVIRRVDDTNVSIALPLFWYDPPWIDLPPIIAARLAASVANMDVTVSALHRDLTDDDDQTGELFQPIEGDDPLTASAPPRYLPRMTPYRIERYGFVSQDFDHAQVIDVRLSPSRDSSGRFAYSPGQMQRWERSPADSPISGGGYVAASTFPADIITVEQAKTKLEQLRRLAPTAAVFISITSYRLEEELSAAIAAHPDGLILRLDETEFEGLQLAGIVSGTREFLRRKKLSHLPLWVVPGEITVDDVSKLIALGASAVAIDSWCAPLLDVIQEELQHAHSYEPVLREIPTMVSHHLWSDIDRVVGLCSSIDLDKPTQERLGTYHAKWAKACNATMLA
ncbi:hypothetical protein [Rhodopirellula sp. MGV]|uniref:hypothetical protein n=1 Tax=Rhodopirellula sp. MGV TaxID=2023130 RepID=UPI000B9739A8|nr:hypothetical protein [Rhodopirellula sp. MGV]OYP32161.1 hypothetical protein CGZ80_20400 [Rhodopirellula sp. MGV]PNY35167.1 hypothetical protein C2E31_19925 [Rhodopirellula baltica]